MTSTRWDIGHKFWVARCRKISEVVKTTDEFGQEWQRYAVRHVAYAKQKIITQIAIDKYGAIYRGTDAEYEKHEAAFSQIFKETEIDRYATELQAMAHALHYANLGQEYFGE